MQSKEEWCKKKSYILLEKPPNTRYCFVSNSVKLCDSCSQHTTVKLGWTPQESQGPHPKQKSHSLFSRATSRECLGGSIGWASAFISSHDPRNLGSSPALGFPLSRESASPCSRSISSLSLSQMIK